MESIDYKKHLDNIKEIIFNKLKILKISGIFIYGSAPNKELFDKNYSDVDVIIFCSNYDSINKDNLLSKIKDIGFNFLEKSPTLIQDNLCNRIEFYIGDYDINFDITITSKLIPTNDELIISSWYDSFETLMGGVYLNSIKYFGEPTDFDLFKKDYYPFYNDELRKKRLDIISNRLISYLKRIESYKKNDKNKYIDHVIKMRKYFMKFLFILNRKYYLTPEKNIYFQLTNILELDNDTASKLSLSYEGSTYEQCVFIVKYAKKTIDNYLKENK